MKKNKIIIKINDFLSVRRRLCILSFLCLFIGEGELKAQEAIKQLVVKGVVTDAATKQFILGAEIRVANTSITGITDEKGEYKLNVPTTGAVLIVSSPGYASREVPMQGQLIRNIELYSDIFYSSENVQTLIKTVRKAESTNAINAMSDLSLSTSMNVEADIQSRLGADVRTITHSGQPGIGASMFIRGLNSLNANAQPLIIVDGIIWDNQLDNSSVHQGFFSNPLSSIDVRDIESVTVVKDGASIYGSKGANGVILINTVRGIDMATKITANMMFGVNEKPTYPQMMNGSQYRIYASDQIQGLLRYGYTQEEINAFKFLNEDPTTSYYKDYHNDSQWMDEVSQNSMVQSYAVSVNGGDDIALYNLSMGYTHNEGTIINTGMERLNARFNSDIRMFPNMYTKVNLSISRSLRDLRDDGINTVTSPGYLALVKAPILSSHKYTKSTGLPSPKLSDYDQLDPLNSLSNPVALVDNALGTSNRLNFNMGVNPYYKIRKNLIIGTTFGYGLNKVKESFFVPQDGLAPVVVNDYGTGYNEVRDLSQRQISLYSDTRVDWDFSLDKDNSLSVTGGFRFLSDSYESDLPRGYNTGNDNIKVLISGLNFKSTLGAYEEWKSMAWYANVAYDFRKKYFLTVAASMDASSRFGSETEEGFRLAGQTWALFPSVSGAWLVTNEDFMDDVPFFNFLKLRASYGLTGNDDIGSYANQSYFNSINYIGRTVGLKLANIQNKAIQWETTKRLGVGLDMSVLNDRLSLSADIYQSKTSNLLTQKLLNPISGIDYYWSNGGELTNKGYELAFNSKVLNLRSLKWELGASFSHYKNEITALPDGDYTIDVLGASILTAVGQPIGTFYGYKTNGVIATTEQAESLNLYRINKNGTRSYYSAGDMLFLEKPDENGLTDGVLNEQDKQIIGNPNPDFYGTIHNRLAYRKFTLDVLFSYSYGNDVYNYLRSNLESGSNMLNQTTAITNRWTTEGQITQVPKSVYGDPMGNSVFSDRWIEDGSYLRLKTVTLSYDLPLNLSYLQGMTIWASVNNLYTWTKYLGSDPEFSMNNTVLYQGIDAGLTPPSRSFFFGVRINL